MNKLLLFLVLACLLFTSCKKDTLSSSITNSVKVDSKKVSELKNYFDSNKKSGGTNKDEYILPEQIPVWDSTIYFPDDKVYAIPLHIEVSNNIQTTRTLVIKVDEVGNVVSAEYTFIRLANSPENLTIEEVLASYPKVFDFNNMPDNFEATMLKYNLEGEIIFSKHYANNQIIETNEKIKSTERAPLANPGAGYVTCIDSWWVTYIEETGQVISIEYLGSYCYESGSGGGGGGSAPVPSCTTACEGALNDLIDDGHPSSESLPIQLLSQTNPSPGVFRKSFQLTWKVYDAITWFILSFEYCDADMWFNVNTNSISKEYVTFNHGGTTTQGWNPPGTTRTYKDVVPNISFGTAVTAMTLNYTVTNTIQSIPGCGACPGQSTDVPMLAMKTFNASDLPW